MKGWGRQLPKWVCQSIILQFFPENCVKIKESSEKLYEIKEHLVRKEDRIRQ